MQKKFRLKTIRDCMIDWRHASACKSIVYATLLAPMHEQLLAYRALRCWPSVIMCRVSEVTSLLEGSGLALQTAAEAREETGGVRNFHLDARCPGLLRHHPALRADLAQSQLVRDGFVVLQVLYFNCNEVYVAIWTLNIHSIHSI